MKAITTTGPKCGCGYGMNSGVMLIEQSDLDAAVAEYETELGRPLTDFERVQVTLPIKKQGAFGVNEGAIRRDQLRQATMVLSMHCNEDGSCPGRVGEVRGAEKQNEANARAKTFAQRLAHAETVLIRHGGKVRNDEPSMDLTELRAVQTIEATRLV